MKKVMVFSVAAILLVIILMSIGPIILEAADGQSDPQIIALNGEWEFYWKQLLEPSHFKADYAKPDYISVPSSWRTVQSQTEDIRAYGYGTYRFVFQVPPSHIGADKALFIRDVGSAYRIWIDGNKLQGIGVIGLNAEEEQPHLRKNLVIFQPGDETVEVIIQVSNYSFREGGIINEILYGDANQLVDLSMKETFYKSVVIGGLFLICLYHLIIFYTRRKDRSLLLIAVIFFAVSMRTLVMDGYICAVMLGITNWELLVKVEYTSELIAFIAVVLLMRNLYPQESHKIMVQISILITCSLFMYVVATPARIYTETLFVQSMIKAVILLYFVFYVGIKAYRNKREGARIHSGVLIVFVLAMTNDTLYYMGILPTIELINFSIILYVLSLGVIVSYRYTQLSIRNDKLLETLEDLNNSLEEKVRERTLSISEANDKRANMLFNVAHDLGTPLVGIQTYIKLLISGKVDVEDKTIMSLLLEKTIYIKRLTDDLYELSKLESGKIEFVKKELSAYQWFQEIYNRFKIDLNNIGFELHVGGHADTLRAYKDATIRIDTVRMEQVIQNYVDNAVKFSKGIHNVIELSAYVKHEHQHDVFVVEVHDFGTGMSVEEQAQVFQRFYSRKERNENGSGLGLAIVKEIIQKHDGQVGVRSQDGKGTVFYFTLPVYSLNGAAPDSINGR